MAREKHWAAIGPLLFTSDGGSEGEITVLDTCGLYVKQAIILKSNILERTDLEIKRVLSRTLIKVGRRTHKIDDFVNITTFLVADASFLSAGEQSRRRIPIADIEQAKFAREPINADRVIPVDCYGDYYTVGNPAPTEDSSNLLIAEQFNGDVTDLQIDTITPASGRPIRCFTLVNPAMGPDNNPDAAVLRFKIGTAGAVFTALTVGEVANLNGFFDSLIIKADALIPPTIVSYRLIIWS